MQPGSRVEARALQEAERALLAGGRLFIFGTGGRVIEASPETGKVITEWDAGDSVLIAPVIAGGVMYVLTEDGTLTAYK